MMPNRKIRTHRFFFPSGLGLTAGLRGKRSFAPHLAGLPPSPNGLFEPHDLQKRLQFLKFLFSQDVQLIGVPFGFLALVFQGF